MLSNDTPDGNGEVGASEAEQQQPDAANDDDMKTEYIKLASDLSMKPRMNVQSNTSVLDDLSDFIEETYAEAEAEYDRSEEKYEGNVIPFPNPKDTIH